MTKDLIKHLVQLAIEKHQLESKSLDSTEDREAVVAAIAETIHENQPRRQGL